MRTDRTNSADEGSTVWSSGSRRSLVETQRSCGYPEPCKPILSEFP